MSNPLSASGGFAGIFSHNNDIRMGQNTYSPKVMREPATSANSEDHGGMKTCENLPFQGKFAYESKGHAF
jgi:hypothetical protein